MNNGTREMQRRGREIVFGYYYISGLFSVIGNASVSSDQSDQCALSDRMLGIKGTVTQK